MTDFMKKDIKRDPAADMPRRIVKMDFAPARVARPYEMRSLKGEEEGTYAATKAKFGALAMTDPDRVVNSDKDRAFSLNPLLREPLGIEEEERRVIEERVQARLKEIMETEVAQARAEGFEAGRKEGFQAAREEFRAEGSQKLQRLDSVIADAEQAKEEIYRANERFVINTIFRVARMVMLKELATDKQYILRLAKELIERVGIRENIRIRIHPSEFETMQSVRDGLDKHFGGLKNLQIEPSNEINAGGCILETEWNAIDATIDTQLKAIEKALLGESSSDAPAASEGDQDPEGSNHS